jgi:Reverse transcriptase (RNA-dependent DNA polymerase)
MSAHRDVVIGADIMYINKIPSFVTKSRNLKFSTAELMLNQKQETLVDHVKCIQRIYLKRGFRVSTFLMDGQFEVIRGDLAKMNITLNTVARGEHVPEVERHIRTIKERVRCVYATLPFTRIPKRMLVEHVYFSIFWLNSFPAHDSVSATLSPRSLVHGTHIDFAKHATLEFGTYVQAHDEHDNTMATRTTGAIALRPTGNNQGGYYLYSLSTGKVLNRNHWTVLPMPNDVIARVHVLARRAAADLTFADRDGEIIPNEADDDDEDIDPNYEPDENSLDDDAADEYDTDVDNDGDDDNDDNAAANEADEANINAIDPDIDIAGVYDFGIEEGDDPNGDNPNEPMVPEPPNDTDAIDENIADTENIDIADDNETEFVIDSPPVTNEPNADEEIEEVIDEAGVRPGIERYNLRAQRPRDYSHLHTTLAHTAMTQFTMKKGIEEFGDDGVDAVLGELQQLHDRKVLMPKIADELTSGERRAALRYLMFLKKKRCGRIKGRGCADGRKQRIYTAKEDASSPTVAIESLMLSCVIDAEEERDVTTVDIPGAFMQADMEDTVHMKMEGKMAELLVRIDPKLYRKFVQMENGKMVLYVELKKALYGTLKAALLFWRLLSTKLSGWGFTANPYDSCVMNKEINGKQCTVLWHVDDLKISHKNADVVTQVIELLETEFGKEAPLTKMRGKVHEYLGMTIDYSEKGKVKFSMIDYVKNMLDGLPGDMDGESATPASNHLFEVNPEATKLDNDAFDMFHHNTAKLLFLCKRARPDTQTAVSFLCTRVKGPDVDDYQKLRRG